MPGNYYSNPNPQFLDSNGDPVSGGKVEFFEAGSTTTDQDTFTDKELTVGNENTNPIILDASGRSPTAIFLQQKFYNVRLLDSADALIWARDDVSSLSAALLAVDVGIFGAVGDGVTDDVTNINTGITTLSAAGGGMLFFPFATYAIDPGVSPIIMKSNVTLELNGSTIKRIGSNSDARMLENDDYQASSVDVNIHVISTGAPALFLGTGDTVAVSGTGHGIGWFGLTGWSVRNIITEKTNGDGIQYRESDDGLLEDIIVKDFGRNGMSPTSGLNCVWKNVDVQGPAIAGANPAVPIDVESNGATELTGLVMDSVRAARIAFVDPNTASTGTFVISVQMTNCEFGPGLRAIRFKSTNDTVTDDCIIDGSCISRGSGANGPALEIDNVGGIRVGAALLECSTSTGSPPGIGIENTVDGLRLNGTQFRDVTRSIQAFDAVDLLKNAKVRSCDLGSVFLTGTDNEFRDCTINTLTISRAATIDNQFPNTPITSITLANSGTTEAQIVTPVRTLPVDDATPSVAGGRYFVTANTSITITTFDDGMKGQEILIVFGDANTTIDFTGTNLEGNAGVDFAAAVNDHMNCIFDGTNWFCDVSDNTA